VHSAVWAQSILVLLYCQDNNTLTEHLLVELVQIRDSMYRETVVSSQFRHRGFLLEYHQGTRFRLLTAVRKSAKESISPDWWVTTTTIRSSRAIDAPMPATTAPEEKNM